MLKVTKLLFVVAVIPCCTCLITAQEKKAKTDKQLNHLKGPVKAVIYQDVPPADDPHGWGEELMQPFVQRRIITYDVNGKKLREEPPTGVCGNDLIFKQRTSHIAHMISKATFDKQGNLIKEVVYETGGALINKSVWTYDSQGNMLTWAYYGPRGRLEGKSMYKYDKKGNRLEAALYRRGQILDRREHYSYNEQGDIVEYVSYNGNGSLQHKRAYEYEYDAHGNWVKETWLEWVVEDGKSYFKPGGARYRIITYYQN